MDSFSRIVISGDGTVLVLDDELIAGLPLAEVLPCSDPLRVVAERALANTHLGSNPSQEQANAFVDEFVVRVVPAHDGSVAAVEVTVATADVVSLSVETWRLPDSPEPVGSTADAVIDLADISRAAGVSAYARTLLLPGLPAFLSGVEEVFTEHRAMRDLRIVHRDSGDIRTVRLYGWLPSADASSTDGGAARPAQTGIARPGQTGIARPGQAIGIAVDITELSTGPDPSTRFFEAIVAVVPDSVMVLELTSGQILWSNGRMSDRLGYPRSRINRYSDIRDLLHPGDHETLRSLAEAIRADPTSGPGEARFRLLDASSEWRWMHVWVAPWLSNPQGAVEQVVCMLRDVDESVRAEHQMAWEAGHDPLTGLANRRVITDTLQRAADNATDARRHVYFIDLDDFKKVNDAYGHSIGDELLRTLAARISLLVGAADIVGRFGGDELVIISSQPPEQLGERLLASIGRPVTVGGAELAVTTSIGAALVGVGEDPGDVVRRSNEAMYSAKRGGGNRYVIAGPLNTGPAQRRVEVEAELRRAVAGSGAQMQMVFQPIVDVDRVPIAAEALLRWQHPTRGTLLPSQFLDVAEATGLMTDLSELIIRQAIGAVAEWTAAGQPLMVTVNAGRRELGTGRFARLISAAIDETGIRPEQVCLEVTESVLVDAESPELAELWRLRELGLEIALDDFGTGYAPLTYLKRLPATMLKLDKSFVSGLGLPVPDPVDLAVSRAVALLADELGLRVIAEGVESERQMQTLMSIGYTWFQGFWAHPPMHAGAMGRLLTVG
ncbi:putative bifunctional diguanylate cyclase/phosphodiesterase [Jatrophihabitans sp. DSM 45814]